jgi:anaerobic magnesium-protoporphyrin IX monomethyl ester cyclase
MFVTLIRSPELVTDRSNALTTPPVGIAYLGGFLRKHGIDVQLIDALGEGLNLYNSLLEFPDRAGFYLHGLSLDQVVDKIDSKAKIIGVSCMFSQDWPLNRELIRKIRKKFPNSIIIAGGEHISAVPAFVMNNCPELDYCLCGEGEIALLSLVEKLSLNCTVSLEEIPSLVYRLDNSIKHSNAIPKRIQDIDSIPWPAWDLVPIENYLETGSGYGINKGRNMPIVATRGCPYACTFCSNPQMWTTKWVARNPKCVVDEIESYVKKYSANNFDFYDLTAIVRKDWIIKFCAELEQRNLKITYQLPSGTRSEAIDAEVCAALKRTGCCHITYAPESGSNNTLKKVNKRLKLTNLFASMRSAVDQKLFIKMNIVLGFPHETHLDILKTMVFLARCAWIGVHDVFIFTFSPYPGSQLFKELREKGNIPQLSDDYFFSLSTYIDLNRAISYAEKIPSWQLSYYRIFGLCFFYGLSFLFHPFRALHILRNLSSPISETRIEAFLKTRLTKINFIDNAIIRNKA